MCKFVAFAVLVAVLVGLGCSRPAETTIEKEEKPKLDVPFVRSHENVVAAMLKMAKVKESDTVYDLGCGDGRIVISAVKNFNAKHGIGIDLDPARLKDCDNRMRLEKLTDEQKSRLTFKQGDVLKLTAEDFRDVDVVTMYLFPEINLKLKPVLLQGLKPGARVVSHDFDMGDDWKPDERIEERLTETAPFPDKIYLWVIKEKDKK